MNASSEDLVRCAKELSASKGDQFWRRTLVRIFAAHAEGIIFHLKQSTLLLASHIKVTFTEGEIAFLKEVSFELDEKGHVSERGGKYPKFLSNFRFACQSFCRANRSDLILKYDVHGFESFQHMVKLRDRLTHPKSTNALTISDEEIEDIRKAIIWYHLHLRSLVSESQKCFEARIRKEKERAEARRATKSPPS